MSYQVLARKWRPSRFQEMVGQEHVLKALVNALDDDRLHHAYLFTGTRGVGKTSIARLFAKSLNCETGVSSTPCGECSACREIAEGRFVDLIEVDAASRTKVEDTRELLENVQYAPTHGRFKVYLIDEVHMLSTHSFNALLKTLEEPPPHVKFLLATTDPQKLPVTILSRCLQFNLKNLIPERIVNHLQFVLGEERVTFDDPALWLLARSADGSMRDALSLTDQAIAFGAGTITEADVSAMLGTIDQRLVHRILQSLAESDARGLMAAVNDLSQFSPDYNTVLADLISVLHRIAMGQVIPDAIDNTMGDQEQITALAKCLSAEDVQLYYQVALMGRKDLPFVPDPKEGMEMVLLRMLAFRPASAPPRSVSIPEQSTSVNTNEAVAQPAANNTVNHVVTNEVSSTTAARESTPQSEPAAEYVSAPVEPEQTQAPPHLEEVPPYHSAQGEVENVKKSEAVDHGDDVPPWDISDAQAYSAETDSVGITEKAEIPTLVAEEPVLETKQVEPAAAVEPQQPKPVSHLPELVDCPTSLSELELPHWVLLSRCIGLSGMTESLASHLSLEQVDNERLVFHYQPEQQALLDATQQQRIGTALSDYFKAPVEVEFLQATQQQETPAEYQQRKREERHAIAVESIRGDATVQLLQEHFDAQIDLRSVAPID